MSPSKKTVAIGLVALAGVLVVDDVSRLVDDTPGNTYSSIIQGQNWLAGLVGYASVHVTRKPDQKALTSSWWFVGGGAILAGVGAEVLGGGVFGLILGAGLGWSFWGNSGKS